VSQVIQVTRNKDTSRIEDIKFFKEFYEADSHLQIHHLKNLLEIVEVAPGMITVIDHDSESSDKPAD